MDHSLYGYLSRQSTPMLRMLQEIYEKKEEPYDKEVCRMIRDILALRKAQASV